jgi:hypothetical protein
MGFWHLALVVGLITWTACVFLRAVAARTCMLRLELIPLPEEPYEATAKPVGPIPVAAELPQLAAVVNNQQPGKNDHAKPSGNGKSSSNGSSNGNGHAKIPVKRPGR